MAFNTNAHEAVFGRRLHHIHVHSVRYLETKQREALASISSRTAKDVWKKGPMAHTFEKHLEHVKSALCVWLGNPELFIKATGSHQSRIQQVSTVGSANEDYTNIWCEAIHLSKQLV